MAELRQSDFLLIDDLFEMGGGYVLDFSDRTFANFFSEELKLDIEDPVFSKQGTSKAKRLRCFLKTVDAKTAVRSLNALWEYRVAMREHRGLLEKVPRAKNRLDTLLGRLQGNTEALKKHSVQPAPGCPPPELVAQLQEELVALASLQPQPRGYAFERFLKRLFDAFGDYLMPLDWRPGKHSGFAASRLTAVSCLGMKLTFSRPNGKMLRVGLKIYTPSMGRSNRRRLGLVVFL